MFLFFTAPAPTGIYTLSLHVALPISAPATAARTSGGRSAGGGCRPGPGARPRDRRRCARRDRGAARARRRWPAPARSEEHTSELQSQFHLVCRLLLEKKKKTRLATRI